VSMRHSDFSPSPMDIVERARVFATAAHAGQTRKYTGADYITHPAAVVELLLRHVPDVTAAQLAAAWLHDMEDCDVDPSVLVDEFGQEVASLVEQLTDISTSADGDREARKSIDRAHTALATAQAQDIKIADIADNTQSIVDLDPEFAVIYLTEKQRQLEVLGEGCQELMAIAKGYVEYGLSRLAAT